MFHTIQHSHCIVSSIIYLVTWRWHSWKPVTCLVLTQKNIHLIVKKPLPLIRNICESVNNLDSLSDNLFFWVGGGGRGYEYLADYLNFWKEMKTQIPQCTKYNPSIYPFQLLTAQKRSCNPALNKQLHLRLYTHLLPHTTPIMPLAMNVASPAERWQVNSAVIVKMRLQVHSYLIALQLSSSRD